MPLPEIVLYRGETEIMHLYPKLLWLNVGNLEYGEYIVVV